MRILPLDLKWNLSPATVFAQTACFSVFSTASLWFLSSVLAAEVHAEEPLQNTRWLAAEPTTVKEVYGQTIRETPKRSAADEQAGFHLPAGFKIELIACEPQIAKPMNMAFDQAGKLWVTQSTQYPFPAAHEQADPSQADPAKPRKSQVAGDSIVVLEDRDHDGSFESSKVFADKLNIPIGLLPYQDGVLCFSIPNIWFLRDTDGDGHCDQRSIVVGPFDTSRDTHGMVNSLRDGGDGWIYACHGFNNESRVQGSDGHVVSMSSGNTFRFRPDGSRVELFTQGQVNPFGMAQDRWGFWYAADCHSKPISQLISGGCYPSFGRPDDGLGFVPPMMDHLHGSTAISGLAHTKDSRFPIEFQDHFLSGNVMTCRINRNQILYTGATAKAVDMPDLLTSDDPWFRPVDLQFGPDGKLYVADFYNKIIGHYEVPLDHPDRDRTSGRIWRIQWEGDGECITPLASDKAKAISRTQQEQLSQLALLNPIEAKATLDRLCNSLLPDSATQALSEQELALVIGFARSLDSKQISQAMLLQSVSQLVARSAQMGGSSSMQQQGADWLFAVQDRIDAKSDPVLAQTVLISLRKCIQAMLESDSNSFQIWIQNAMADLHVKQDPLLIHSPKYQGLLRVLLAIKNPGAASAVLDLLEQQKDPAAMSGMDTLVDRLAEVIDDAGADRLFRLIDRMSSDLHSTSDWILRLGNRQKSQRGKVLDSLVDKAQRKLPLLCQDWIAEADKQKSSDPDWCLVRWRSVPGPSGDSARWGLEQRALSPSKEATDAAGVDVPRGTFYSSLSRGEKYTGTWKTAPFLAPEFLAFRVVGHNGPPNEPDHTKNWVRLVLLDATGEVSQELARAYPPRSDVAVQVQWNLNAYQGQPVEIQVHDGDGGDSYAWIGVGEWDQQGMNPGSLQNRWKKIGEFINTFGWPKDASLAQGVEAILTTQSVDAASRIDLQVLRFKRSQPVLAELADFALQQNWLDMLVTRPLKMEQGPSKTKIDSLGMKLDWGDVNPDQVADLATAITKRCSAKQQEQLVKQLSRHRVAIATLTTLCGNGSLSREALAVLQPSFWQSLDGPGSELLVAMRPTEPTDLSRQAVVDRKASELASVTVDLDVGRKQFADRCANCHKLGDLGRVVGPQLEGVGARGLSRLCEDILWPDRNVDEAFRMTLLVLEGGESVSGLVTDRNDESITLTDQAGKPKRILVAEIEQEKRSKLSLMPGNFEELMTDQELGSLIGYLRKEAGLVPVSNNAATTNE